MVRCLKHTVLYYELAMNEARPSEADESSLTPAQVQRAREAIEYLSSIPFRGNVRDSGI